MSTTWINLQDAFVAESNALGDWGQIGYSAPGVKSTSAKFTSKEFEYTGAAGTWNAKNLHALNDCPINTTGWVLTGTLGTSDKSTWSIAVTQTGTSVAECLALTPSFVTLARSTAQ